MWRPDSHYPLYCLLLTGREQCDHELSPSPASQRSNSSHEHKLHRKVFWVHYSYNPVEFINFKYGGPLQLSPYRGELLWNLLVAHFFACFNTYSWYMASHKVIVLFSAGYQVHQKTFWTDTPSLWQFLLKLCKMWIVVTSKPPVIPIFASGVLNEACLLTCLKGLECTGMLCSLLSNVSCGLWHAANLEGEGFEYCIRHFNEGCSSSHAFVG